MTITSSSRVFRWIPSISKLLMIAPLALVSHVALGQNSVPAKSISTGGSSIPAPQVHQQQMQLQLMHLLEQLTPYRPAKELKGKATLTGSTTMYDLGHQWALNFKQFHPNVEFSGKAEGSEAALKALAADNNVIAGVSRPVNKQDQQLLQSGKCKEPMAIIVATDAMAICVHQDNPIQQLSPEQIQSIFAADSDGSSKTKSWNSLGVDGPLGSQPIHIYGREEGSGTGAYLSRTVLAGAAAAKPTKSFLSNADVVKAIAEDRTAIGICALSTSSVGIRKLPLEIQGQVVAADDASVLAGKYPLLRPLILVIDREQLKSDGGLRESVLRYVLSKDGQTEVMKAGFFPLDPAFARQQLDAIGGQQLR